MQTKIIDIFLISYIEALLMNPHNMYFHGEIRNENLDTPFYLELCICYGAIIYFFSYPQL